MKNIALTLMVFLISCGPNKAERKEESLIRFRVAQDLLSKGEATQGMSELMKAADLNPDDSEIQNMLGLSYAQRGLLPEAEKHFKRAVSLDKTFSEAHNHLCALYIQTTRYDDAIASCQKAVENITYITPERAYHNMGLAYERKGELQKAIDSYRRGLVHNKSFVLSRKSLGNILAQQNRHGESVKEYEEAKKGCDAAPKGAWGTECPEVYYRLALGYVKLQQKPKAVATFKDCVKVDEEGKYGEKCRANLKLLE